MADPILSDVYIPKKNLTTTTMIQGKDASQMDMNDFFNLLVAQMTNQDMMNPTNDTEFIAQMAQFSALQGVQTIQEYQLSAYATSYVGKTVTIAHADDNGSLKTVEGVVERVTFYDGKPQVLVGGKAYELHTVMEVIDPTAVAAQQATGSGAVSLSEASSYIGKIVLVEYMDTDGVKVSKEGVVTSAVLKNGLSHVMIEGKSYPARAIVHVRNREEEASGSEQDTDSF